MTIIFFSFFNRGGHAAARFVVLSLSITAIVLFIALKSMVQIQDLKFKSPNSSKDIYHAETHNDLTYGVLSNHVTDNEIHSSQSFHHYYDQSTYDPSKYTFIIIHYHKTGFVVSTNILKILRKEGKKRGQLTGRKKASYPKRQHDNVTKCPKYDKLHPGTLFLQTAPNLFCSSQALIKYLNLSGGRRQGVKIIHMVRNPYHMAISNYFYHAQIPTPERWIHKAMPCEYRYFPESYIKELAPKSIGNTVESTISKTSKSLDEEESMKSLILPTLTEISPKQFDKAFRMCRALFRNETSFWSTSEISRGNASFYDHLLFLDQYDGIRLSAAQMILSSGLEFFKAPLSIERLRKRKRHAGADILRMGNNIRKLNEVTANTEQFRVLTMDMANWISKPHESSLNVVDFVFGSSATIEEKRNMADSYVELFVNEVADDSSHVTSGKAYHKEEKAAMIDMLKKDDALGPILDVVEKLVDESLERDT